MLNIGELAYSPVLRLKQGEYSALGKLPLDILARLLPFFVIPPPKERDPELHRALTASELVLLPGQRLGRHWPLRPCMVDARYLFKKLGVDTATSGFLNSFGLRLQRTRDRYPSVICGLSRAARTTQSTLWFVTLARISH